MKNKRIGKKQRQVELLKCISKDPLLKDEELAEFFGVSIQTIRLDRQELKIPELWERIRIALKENRSLNSINTSDLIGELIDYEEGRYAVSVLNINSEMTFQKSLIARGHHLFAQANSLAVLVVNKHSVLTGLSRVEFKQPVKSGQAVISRAEFIRKTRDRFIVKVKSQVEKVTVFEGIFILLRIND